jgi:hypothetical protein
MNWKGRGEKWLCLYVRRLRGLCIREDNIKTDIKEVGWGVTDWVDLVQDRGRWWGSCECGNEISGSKKCGEILTS